MRYFGHWRTREDPSLCVAEVWYDAWHHAKQRRQCTRKRGHGPNRMFCAQHARMFEAGKILDVPTDRQEEEAE